MKPIYLFLFCLLSINMTQSQVIKTPADVVQENLDYYNQRNIEGFMSSFPDTIALYLFGKSDPVAFGKEAIRKLYKDLFDVSPKLHSTILHRIVLGDKVIDHESIKGRKGSKKRTKLVMIYEVSGDKIVRMTVIR
ncbi:MAG: nuclear transport factor 2 family protein [Crocinitomicaceae bacterium]|nr:nuclear transport factor 2 family protein [Crocinitomicaceae bacterium]